MTERHSFISATLAELNRRKVLRTVGAYAVAVFVLLQLMDAAVEPLRLPDWLPTLVVIVVILGFPLVFLLAWHLEIRPDGVHRTERAGLLSRTQSAILFSFMLVSMGGLASVSTSIIRALFEDTAIKTRQLVAAGVHGPGKLHCGPAVYRFVAEALTRANSRTESPRKF